MAAIIRSIRNGDSLTAVIGASRDDLRAGDLVTCNSVDTHTTYQWSLDFTPQDPDGTPSSAVLTSTTSSITAFTVDHEGSYLLRLVVDASLPTESSQTVRLRALTVFGKIKLVAAGERNDSTGVIPVDISSEGWANDQNMNLQTILGFTKKISSSGRILYVDANRGTDYSNTPNDPTVAEGYGDYSSIQGAISAALADPVTPSQENPYTVIVRPGLYVEDIQFEPFVHVVGLPRSSTEEIDRSIVIKSDSAGSSLTTNLPLSSDTTVLFGLSFENEDLSNTTGVINKTGDGTLIFQHCSVIQKADDPSIGPPILLEEGSIEGYRSLFLSEATSSTRVSFSQDGEDTSSIFESCTFEGPSGVDINPSEDLGPTAIFNRCQIISNLSSALAFGLRTSAEFTAINYCLIETDPATSEGIQIHPTGLAFSGDVLASIRWTKIEGEISFNAIGISGNSVLDIGSLEYEALNVTGTLSSGPNALVQSRTLFYDNSSSSLTAENVQDAIDELAASIGGATLAVQDEGSGIGSFGTFNFTGAAVTAAAGAPGVVDITVTGTGSSSTTLVVRETPSGTLDGVNTIFTLSSTSIVSGSEQVFLNGVLQDTTAGDYIFTGPNIIDFSPSSPPTSSEILRVTYLDTTAGSGTLVVRDSPSGLINGINLIFTLSASSIITGSEQVFFNGVLLDPTAGDYIFTGPNIIDFSPIGAPIPGDIIRVTYLIP